MKSERKMLVKEFESFLNDVESFAKEHKVQFDVFIIFIVIISHQFEKEDSREIGIEQDCFFNHQSNVY